MGQAAVPIMIISTIASGVNTIRQQNAAGRVASAEAQIAANREGDAARAREIERRRALLRSLASQNAVSGAYGVDPNMTIAGADINYATNDFYTDQANTQATQAMLRLQGKNAKRAGTAGAFTTLLDTTASTASLWPSKPKPKGP